MAAEGTAPRGARGRVVRPAPLGPVKAGAPFMAAGYCLLQLLLREGSQAVQQRGALALHR